jgi:LDH2 family malate/lactate/ureidoglycolate dehydrogenase
VESLVGAIHAAGSSRLPGSRRHARRERASLEGIEVAPSSLETLERLAAGH